MNTNMNTNKENIFFDHYDTINRLFKGDNEDFSELSHTERLEIVKKMCKYMHDSYTTKKMESLYKSFTEASENEKGEFAHEILSEFMKYVNEILGKTNTKSEKNKNKTKNTKIPEKPKNIAEETYKWLCNKLPDFHNIDLLSENALIYGKVQSGKTENIFGVALMHILTGGKVVIVGRNSIKDAVHMKVKLARFSHEHQEAMKRAGIDKPTVFDSVYAGDMSFKRDGSGISGDEKVIEAFTGPHRKVVIAINNGTQLCAVNKILDSVGNDKLMIILDEADVTGYAVVNADPPAFHAAIAMVNLKLRCSHIFEVTATVWDILKGNSGLTNRNIYEIRPSGDYKGVLSVRSVNLENKIVNDIEQPFNKQDPNFDDILQTLTISPYFNDEFGVTGGHPICLLHKTYVQIQHIDMVFDYMRKSPKFNKKWVVIKEHSEDICMYAHCLKGQNIIIEGVTIEDKEGHGVFSFPKKVIIPHILQWLKDNGGVDKFSHIFIKSGKFADRCRSYVSADGTWHLTHEYSGDYKNLPAAIQGMRLLHNRPDAIPLTYYATKKTNENIRKGYLHQEEQIERLKNDEDSVFTSKRVDEEKWSKDKVPSFKLCCESTRNSKFRIEKENKVKGEDGFKSVSVYKEELKKIIMFDTLRKTINKVFGGKDKAKKFKEGQKPGDMKEEVDEDDEDDMKKMFGKNFDLNKVKGWMSGSTWVGKMIKFLYDNPGSISFEDFRDAIGYDGTDKQFQNNLNNGRNKKGTQYGYLWVVTKGSIELNENLRKYM